ncbi:iron complex transport system permease protein [Paenibacillus sp. UNCCL117]|uniref:FecCD family ABC transporter permease n=1 Tax=unclassified Paenibacillus TaxID=185978 RepID=UPI0008901649|nr:MULTISPECIES: iron ABC transporter permease [unclassified Paenibacillus]SDD70487.1 iron complex transport system permease protein [Paenibacillus sp. cl123]SFW45351.1 iron complex transport system permease protein [Paenibacillus sp. UNCCL117]
MLKLLGLAVGFILLLLGLLASILFGHQQFSLHTLWQAYHHFDGSNEHLILVNSRVPRSLVAAMVGASLALAGAIMQVITKNPIASPSVFGINSGAVLFVVIGLAWFGSALTMSGMIWLAFAGASVTALFVYALSLQGSARFEPVKLTLAGASVAAFASAVTSGIILIRKDSLETALFWMIGSVSGRQLEHLYIVLPYMAAGWLTAMLLSGSLNILALGDDIARGLGQRLMLIRGIAAAAVVLLAGCSVAVAGPIAFIGLIVPHLCRYLVGNDHRWLLPYSACTGALLLVVADLASRFIIISKEVPVGVATALIGVPFLIHVARRSQHAQS